MSTDKGHYSDKELGKEIREENYVEISDVVKKERNKVFI